jgi:hypothetical protein
MNVNAIERRKMMENSKPKVYIPKDNYDLLFALCDAGIEQAKSEVSGFASVEFDEKENCFTIGEPFMVKQKGSGASTELDEQAVAKATYERRDQKWALKCHWHTHPNMGVFWSGTDMSMIKDMGEHGWKIFLVINEKREMRAAFYQVVDFIGGSTELFLDELECLIDEPINKEVQDKALQMFKDNYSREFPTYSSGRVYDGGSVYDYSQWDDAYWNGSTNHWDEKAVNAKTYNNFGEKYFNKLGRKVYNPFRDTYCKDDADITDEINGLDQQQLQDLYKVDKTFAKEYAKLVDRIATGNMGVK